MSMDNPLVSVIIPTYNRSSYILKTLQSVFDQTYPYIEVIVVDDGSSDNTQQVIKEYLPKIRYIYQNNKGNAAARNTGIKNAHGQYVAFLDSDDAWLKEKIEKQVRFMQKHQDTAFVYCGAYLIDENDQIVGKRLLQEGEDACFETLFIKNRIISLSFVMARKDYLHDVGLFDESLRQSPDYDLYLRLAKKYPYACINELLCQYRVHSGNISSNLEGRIKAHLRIFSKSDIMQGIGFWGTIRRKAKIFYQVACLYYDEKQYLEASKKFFLCLLRDPYFGITYKDKKFRGIYGSGMYEVFKIYYLVFFCLGRHFSSSVSTKK